MSQSIQIFDSLNIYKIMDQNVQKALTFGPCIASILNRHTNVTGYKDVTHVHQYIPFTFSEK